MEEIIDDDIFRDDPPLVRWEDYIERRPDVSFGKPVFTGTRVPVNLIFEFLAAGTSFEEVLEGYPFLRLEHLQAAMLYAADLALAQRVGKAFTRADLEGSRTEEAGVVAAHG